MSCSAANNSTASACRPAAPAVVADSFVGTGTEKGRHRKGWRIASGVTRRAVRSQLNGAWKDTIFFDLDTGLPTVEPVLLPRSIGR